MSIGVQALAGGMFSTLLGAPLGWNGCMITPLALYPTPLLHTPYAPVGQGMMGLFLLAPTHPFRPSHVCPHCCFPEKLFPPIILGPNLVCY